MLTLLPPDANPASPVSQVDIYWRDWRSLCAVKFLRLEEFIDDVRDGMALQLEPQGLLFAEVRPDGGEGSYLRCRRYGDEGDVVTRAD